MKHLGIIMGIYIYLLYNYMIPGVLSLIFKVQN